MIYLRRTIFDNYHGPPSSYLTSLNPKGSHRVTLLFDPVDVQFKLLRGRQDTYQHFVQNPV